MPRYHEVFAAAGETATKILAQRIQRGMQIGMTTEGGSTASVVWSHAQNTVTLNLPTLPPDTMLTRAESDRIVAYLAHECCHVIHTKWDEWELAVHAGPALKHLVNCLEDVRIERTEIAAGHYPALRGLLGSLMTQKHAEALARAKADGVIIGRDLQHFPYVCAVLGRMANGYSVPTAHGLERDLPPRVRALVTAALKALPGCRSTRDVRLLAIRLLAQAEALREQPKQPEAPKQEPQDGAGEAGEPQDGAGEAGEPQDGQDGAGEAGEPQDGQDGAGEAGEPQDGQDGAGEAGEPQDGQDGAGEAGEPQDGQDGAGEPQDGQDGAGEPQDGQDGAGEPQDGQDGAGGDEGGQGEAIDPDDMTDMVRDVAQRADPATMAAIRSGQSHVHRLPTCPTRVTVASELGHPTGWHQSAAVHLNTAMPRSSVLHGQIARMLVAEEKSRTTHHETAGRLDRRALARMRSGALDVYSRREESPAVSTAVLILLDGSSSMTAQSANGMSRTQMAAITAWQLARAAEDAGGKVCVAAFYGDVTGAHLVVAKPFDRPCAAAAGAINSLQAIQMTPLSPAILRAAGMLADVPGATRRIVLCVTDGGCSFMEGAVKAACRIASDMGVEVAGVGIACPGAIAAFPPGYSVNVDNLDQLARTGLGALVTMLEDAAPDRERR